MNQLSFSMISRPFLLFSNYFMCILFSIYAILISINLSLDEKIKVITYDGIIRSIKHLLCNISSLMDH